MNFNMNEWNQTEAKTGGEFKELPAGGYVCAIIDADAVTSRKGTPQLKLSIDIDEGEYHDCFMDEYQRKQKTNKDAVWPCVFYQGVSGKSLAFFKGLLEMIRQSNPGYVPAPDASGNFNEKTLIGKRIGFVFREEEREYNGKIYTNARPRFAKTVEDIQNGNFVVPDKLTVEKHAFGSTANDEEIPF